MKANTYWLISVLSVVMSPLWAGQVIYVDDDAPLGGDGQSWQTAFRFLQDGLQSAIAGAGDVEIHVAQGQYKPDRSTLTSAGSGDREVSFEVPEGVSLKGGYAGLTGIDPNEWGVELYETILSGDLAGDDVAVDDPCDLYGEPTRLDNCLHVVVARRSATIDGFLITGGYAAKSPFGDVVPLPWNSGGGIYVIGDDACIRNCLIQGNLAYHGGGGIHVWGDLSGIRLSHCRIVGNADQGLGGGGLYTSSDLELTDCEFVGNWAHHDGGGIYSSGDEIKLLRCDFVENKSDSWGGGISVGNGDVLFSNCFIKYNVSGKAGGGVL